MPTQTPKTAIEMHLEQLQQELATLRSKLAEQSSPSKARTRPTQSLIEALEAIPKRRHTDG